MRKIYLTLITLVIMSLGMSSVYAGGDKVRGDEGAGGTVQACLNFDGCPYGTEDPEDYTLTTLESDNYFTDLLIQLTGNSDSVSWLLDNPFIGGMISEDITLYVTEVTPELFTEIDENASSHLTLSIFKKI